VNMSLMTNQERTKLKLLLSKCFDSNGKLNHDKIDVFLEIAVRFGYDLRDEQVELERQEHEAKVEARAIQWDRD